MSSFRDPNKGVSTRSKEKESAMILQLEPNNVKEALEDEH